MVDWHRQKDDLLARPDKSIKGSVDTPFLPLFEIVNDSADMATTSCCSGRITLFGEAAENRKKGGKLIYVSHEYIDNTKELFESLKSYENTYPTVWLKFEPFVMHIDCLSIDVAKEVLSMAVKLGFKNSGMLSLDKRCVVALRGCIRLETPVVSGSTRIASDDYIRQVVSICNDKLRENLSQIEKLTRQFRTLLNLPEIAILSALPPHPETDLRAFGSAYTETDDLVFIFSGHAGARQNNMWIFRKTDETWISAESGIRPEPRVFSAAAFPFIFGGRKSPAEPLDDLWKFDSVGNFKKIPYNADWPEPRYRHCMASKGGLLFLIGGVDRSGQALRSFWQFDGNWTLLPPCPVDVVGGCAVIAEDRVWVVTGEMSGLHVYDLAAGVWKFLEAVADDKHGYPQSRNVHAVCKHGRDFYMIGGLSNKSSILRDVWTFSIGETLTWKFLANLPENQWRMRCAAGAFRNSLFLFGGGGTVFTFGSVFDPPVKMALPERHNNLYAVVFEKTQLQKVRDSLRAQGLFDENRKMRVHGESWALPILAETEDFPVVSINQDAPLPVQTPAKLSVKYERLGDIILLPKASREIVEKLYGQNWAGFCADNKARGVGALGEQITGDTRLSGNELLYVDPSNPTPFVHHIENGITYYLDVTRHMFASGNGTERMRMANPPKLKNSETVVDLFSGIGYFSLPYVVKNPQVTHLIACDWNASAIDCLRQAVALNKVDSERVTFHVGDSSTADAALGENVADRISLGLIPDSSMAWRAASKLLKEEGWLHVHGIAKDAEAWKAETLTAFKCLGLEIIEANLVKVKNYRPHVKHYVLDIFARKLVR